MDLVLTPVEARIVGALIEKQITTPEYYPLTLNSLTAACNQKSNREPVMNLDEKTVVRTLDSLRQKHLVWQKSTAEGRVPKYDHRIETLCEFAKQEICILCVLLLRGPQTIGEIRTRTARMYEFSDIDEVEMTLQKLIDSEAGPFVAKLPLQAGRRENRYAHLLCGEVQVTEECLIPPPEAATLQVRAENERIADLEEKVKDLYAEIKELKARFNKFIQEFE